MHTVTNITQLKCPYWQRRYMRFFISLFFLKTMINCAEASQQRLAGPVAFFQNTDSANGQTGNNTTNLNPSKVSVFLFFFVLGSIFSLVKNYLTSYIKQRILPSKKKKTTCSKHLAMELKKIDQKQSKASENISMHKS